MTDAGYIQRTPSAIDNRRVHILITTTGEAVLASLTTVHRQEYRQLADALRHLIDRFESA
jgi:DNA-binding MarR family transcriptional regulator